MNLQSFGFGVTGSLPVTTVRELAPIVEAAGFRTMWFNDTPGGNALERIGVAASVTTTLRFATGVIPVDRRPVHEILDGLVEHDVPMDRISLGIGSSAKPSPLTRVEESIAGLRERVDVPLYVGALGPRMRALAAAHADGLLLNWLTPGAARFAQEDKARDEAARDGSTTKLALYIRTAKGDAAAARLADEAKRYSSIPSYAANFARLGISAMESSVHGSQGSDLVQGLRRFEGIVDEPVVRAISGDDSLASYNDLIDSLANH